MSAVNQFRHFRCILIIIFVNSQALTVVSSEEKCDDVLKIVYKNKLTKCNEELERSKTREQPSVKCETANPDALYTLVMMDPDAPFPQDPNKAWLHWLVINIEGRALKDRRLKGNVITGYNGPSPPKFSLHRYQFYVKEQTPGHDINTTTIENKIGINLNNFAAENKLKQIAFFQYKSS